MTRILTNSATTSIDLSQPNVVEINATQFNSNIAGIVPASGGGTVNFLRADGTWSNSTPTVLFGITRAQIASNNLSAFSRFLTNDGAPWVPGNSSGTMAIQDSANNWWQLDLSGGYANVKWFEVAGSPDDTAAIQAALNSGGGSPIIVLLPPGIYNVAPPNSSGVNCLNILYDNVTLLLDGATIKAYASGGRDPNTNWDVVSGAVWRGSTVFVQGTRTNFRIYGRGSARITGQCLRSTAAWPYGGTNPPYPADLTTGDGWDITHTAIYFQNDQNHSGCHIEGVEIDGYKGEIVKYPGEGATDFQLRRLVIHDSNADGVSMGGAVILADSEIYHCTQAVESSPYGSDSIYERNYVHDCNIGITLVNQNDFGPSSVSGWTEVRDNTVRNCLGGLFLSQYIRNIRAHHNMFVDCGSWGNYSWGAIQISLNAGTSGNIANIFIEDNLIGVDQSNREQGILISDNTTNITGKYIRRNKTFHTPNALYNGYTLWYGVNFWTNSSSDSTNPYSFEMTDNDFRNCSLGLYNQGGGGPAYERGNTFPGGLPRKEASAVTTQFDKTSDTALADVPGLSQLVGQGEVEQFNAVLYVSANASGGAKVSVAMPGNLAPLSGVGRYRIKMYSGTTLAGATQITADSNTSFGVTAAVDCIEIDGFYQQYQSAGTAALLNGAQTLSIKFAQNASFGTASSVLVGSWLKVAEAGSYYNI
jgi:hypothetical protein